MIVIFKWLIVMIVMRIFRKDSLFQEVIINRYIVLKKLTQQKESIPSVSQFYDYFFSASHSATAVASSPWINLGGIDPFPSIIVCSISS